MVASAHEDTGADAGRRRGARDRGPALDEALQHAEAPGRLDEQILAVAHGRRGVMIDRQNARGTRPVLRRAEPALAHHDGLEWKALGPARSLQTRSHGSLVGPAHAEVG